MLFRSLHVPQISIVRRDGGTTVASAAPVTLDGADGAKIVLSPRAGAPLARMQAATTTGAFALDVAGGRLPKLRLMLASYNYATPNGRTAFSAETQFETALDFGPMRGLRASGQGMMQVLGDRLTVAMPGCASIAFESFLVSATPQLRNATAQICGTQAQPILASTSGGWALDARVTGASADIDRQSTRLNSSHVSESRMPSSA